MDPLPTGISGLDSVLGGGVLGGDTLLVVGEAGTGKTTLALQMAFHSVVQGRTVCFVSTASESPSKLLAHARAYEFYAEEVIGKRLFLVSLFPLIQQGLRAVSEALEKEVRQHRASLLVLDGLTTLYDLHPDAPELRRFIHEFGAVLWALGCTLVITSSRTNPDAQHQFAEFTTADALVRLSQPVADGRSERTLQVVKVRGQSPLLGHHTMRLDSRGLVLFPRFESLDRRQEGPALEGRSPSGLPELDEMIAGGLPTGSVTAVAGAVGTGKTLFALQFLLEGVRAGERGLLLSLGETRAELVRKARGFGLDLDGAFDTGSLVFRHRSPVDLAVDEVVSELDETIERVGCRRFVLDGIEGLAGAIPQEARRATLMAVLSSLLRSRGITAVIPVQVSQIVGPELDLGQTPMAVLAHNLLLLRYVEYGGELHRILSILKARDSGFDASIRRYVIVPDGLRVLARIEDADGLLTGIAHLASEARVKRTVEPETEP